MRATSASQPFALRQGQGGEQGAGLLARALVERRKRAPARGGKGERAGPGVARRRRGVQQAACLEAREEPAQVAGVELQVVGEFARRERRTVGQLPEQARLGEREAGGEQLVGQHADAARVEAVEGTQRVDVGGGDRVGHGGSVGRLIAERNWMIVLLRFP